MFSILSDIALVMRLIRDYPLYTTRAERRSALRRFLSWQIAGRIHTGPLCMEYVNDTRLLVKRRLGGRLPYVLGLPEPNDVAFVAHVLREGEVFADVGANIGVYTVLAGSCAGAHCVAFEPAARAFRYLADNVALNRLENKVELHPCAVGATAGRSAMTSSMGENNHMLSAGEAAETTQVEVVTLDGFFYGRAAPTLLKLDVEGFETAVMDGAHALLSNRPPLAVLLELAGVGPRYGYDEDKLHQRMLDYGYTACSYICKQRSLVRFDPALRIDGSTNVLFVKDVDEAQRRVKAAAPFRVGAATL